MAGEKVIIDTSAFYALASATDEFHSRAKVTYGEMIDEKTLLYTSSYVFVESAALIHHRLGYPALEKFGESLRQALHIIWVDYQIHWQAWDLLKRKAGRGLSFVDCTTVALAKSLNAQIFSFDDNLRKEVLSLIPR